MKTLLVLGFSSWVTLVSSTAFAEHAARDHEIEREVFHEERRVLREEAKNRLLAEEIRRAELRPWRPLSLEEMTHIPLVDHDLLRREMFRHRW